MACKLCDQLQRWLRVRSAVDCDRIWETVQDWESAHSNDGALWAAETGANRALLEQARSLETTDPEAALGLYRQAAEAGSVWAMQTLGWHYGWGSVVAPDHALARKYYHRAICAGSWTATIPYARLLAEAGQFSEARAVLQDGIEAGFIPASFWLARLRLGQARSRKVCREVRPLLDRAAEHGHPGARRLLAGLMLLGKYGLGQVPAGVGMAWACTGEDWAEAQAGGNRSAPPLLPAATA